MLGADLGGRGDLDRLGLVQRALREGGEVGQPLDLDVEQLAADRALLGRRVDVEDVAAERELAAVLDLVDALVAARDELRGRLLEVDQPALLDREAVRAQLGVGDLLGERGGARHDDGGAVRLLVARAARRARPRAGRPGAAAGRGATRSARRGPGRGGPAAGARNVAQVAGQVARGAVVARDDQRRAVGLGVERARPAGTGAGCSRRTRAAAGPPFAAASARAVTALSWWA